MASSILSRRAILAAAAFSAAFAPRAGDLYAATADSLQTHAAAKGLFFGSAVEVPPLEVDAQYRQLLADELGWVVPAVAMKWGQTEAARDVQTYGPAEQIVGFANNNAMRMRGHTAVWYRNIPTWLPDALAEPGGMQVLVQHVGALLGHFKGQVQQWDVVNEAVDPADKRPDGLRNSVFLQHLGPDYIVESFRAARAAAPDAKLFYNDYDFEYDTDYLDRKRQATLALVSRLKRERLIDGLGLQTHLKVGNRFNPKKYADFLRDAAALELVLVATEFDVNDTRLPADLATRDAAIAAHATAVLDVMLDEPAVKGVVTWGLSSRYTWLDVAPVARADGLPSRGLPFDSDMKPTPLRNALATAFDRARPRSPI